jgi:uncharacterized protein (TIRG00374 family)
MNFIKKYSFLIGLGIFFFIILKLDLPKLAVVLGQINYFYLFLASLLAFPFLLAKAYRWNYLKKRQNISYGLKDSFLMYGTGMCLGILTPGRLGELSKIIYLKNDHYSIGKSSVSVILDRISDLLFLLIFSYLGMFFFFSFFQDFILLLSSILIFGLFLLIIFLQTNLIQVSLKKIFGFIVPAKYQKSWKLNFQDFIIDLKIYKSKDYLFIFLITVFSWLIYYLQMFFLAKSININNISFLYLSITVAIAGLLTLLPISVLGLGTRDAILILFFSVFLISNETTVSFSMLILLMSILTALIGLVCWLIKPIQISNDHSLD